MLSSAGTQPAVAHGLAVTWQPPSFLPICLCWAVAAAWVKKKLGGARGIVGTGQAGYAEKNRGEARLCPMPFSLPEAAHSHSARHGGSNALDLALAFDLAIAIAIASALARTIRGWLVLGGEGEGRVEGTGRRGTRSVSRRR